MKRNLNGTDLARAMGGIDARWIDLAYNEEEIRKAAADEKSHAGKRKITDKNSYLEKQCG